MEEYFRELHTKDIYIWGSGRYFKNRTLPFLKRSGLIKCVRGFVQIPGQSVAAVDMGTTGDEASDVNGMRTEIVTQESLGPDAVILIAVSGYREAMEQLAGAQVVPSLFLEALYEDFCMLNVTKPPVGFRKHEMQRIPKVIHTCWFSGEAVHHHHGSWVPGSAKTAMDERYREIGEFLKSLGNSDLAERMKEEKEWI